MDERKRAHQSRRERYGDEFAEPLLLRDGRLGENCEADAGTDHALQRLGAAELHHDVQIRGRDARLAKIEIGELAGTRPRLAAHVGIRHQLLWRHALLPRERVPGGDDHLQLVIAAHFGLERGQVRWGLDQAEVERVLRDAVLDRLGVAYGELGLHLGMERLELAEDAREQELGDRRARADQERPGQPPGHLPQPRLQLRRQREDPFRVLEHHFARRRQCDLAVATLEQPRVEMLFELLDLERDRGLGHEQGLRRLGEAHLLRDGVEHLQPAIGHGPEKTVCYPARRYSIINPAMDQTYDAGIGTYRVRPV